MAEYRDDIYIGTVALEKNRWNYEAKKAPTYLVRDWLGRFAEAGFDGVELWENHAAMADEAELARLTSAPLPITIFNSYASFGDDGAADRRRAAELAKRLGAAGVKFNLPNDPAALDSYVRNVAQWARSLGDGVRLLCECHAGTIMESPGQAADVFRRWGDERFQAIVHPFHTPIDKIAEWFDVLGQRITHAHVQLRGSDREVRLLESDAARVRDALKIMRDGGFGGSFTIEFTEGTGSPDENPEMMFQNAAADMRFLRDSLS